MKLCAIFKQFGLLLILLISIGSHSNETSNEKDNSDVEIGSVHTEDVDISKATEIAQQTVDEFIHLLTNPSTDKQAQGFGIKVAVLDGSIVEHVWLGHLKYADGQFIGVLGNPPRLVKNLQLGQLLTVDKEQILDWAYTKNGTMVGNYTLKALFPYMNPIEVERIKEQVGW